MSEQRPDSAPQFGEYASPEQQRELIRKSLGDAPPPAPSPPAMPAPSWQTATPPVQPSVTGAAAVRRPRTLDRIVTTLLLAYGLLNVITSVPQFFDYTHIMGQWMSMAGLTAHLDRVTDGSLWGHVAGIVYLIGWVITALLSVWSLSRRRVTWWIPVAGALVFSIAASVCLAMPMINDPSILGVS